MSAQFPIDLISDSTNKINKYSDGTVLGDTPDYNENAQELILQTEDPSYEENEFGERKSKPSQNIRLRRKLEDRERKIQDLENALLQEKNRRLEKDEAYNDLLSTNIHWAKTAAENQNDLASKTEADKYISDLQTEKLRTMNERDALKNYRSTVTSTVDPEQEDNYSDFIERNPIFNAKDPRNPNYSPEAFRIMSDLSTKLSLRYKMEGNGEEEFSPKYFKELENLFKGEVGMSNSGGGRRLSSAGPVNSGERSYNRNKEVTFNEDEMKMINGWLKEAKTPEHKEAIKKRYIEAKRNNYRDDSINI